MNFGEIGFKEIADIQKEKDRFPKEIQPKSMFDKELPAKTPTEVKNPSGISEQVCPEKSIEQVYTDYVRDLKGKSECPDTIPNKPFDWSDLRILSPEENALMRDEFDDKKAQLKKEWEEVNGQPWPKYDHDIYSANGKLIRKAGSDYDAHHIQPLGMGGKNEASNITPLNAEVHYDKQGVHAPNSPYSKLEKMLGETEK